MASLNDQRPILAVTSHCCAAKILLVDDAPENLRFIAWVLKKAGGKVEVAGDGAEALQLFTAAVAAGSPFQLVLTDLEMPHMGGIDLTAKLRNLGYFTPIVALTAYASEETELACTLAGCDAYISKPFPPDALIETCCRLLTDRLQTAVTETCVGFSHSLGNPA